jgi:general nucleoside transport system permease protein
VSAPAPAAAPAVAPRAPAAVRRALLEIGGTVGALLAAFAVGAVFIAAIGERPLEIYGLMLHDTFGTGYGIGMTLFKATPLVFTGLAVALGFRAGLFNIGAEGQLYLGGFAAGLVGMAWPQGPFPLLLLLCLVAAAGAGALWGAIPGALKARFGAHEVINTIMLNFIAFALVAYAGRRVFQTATVRTAEIGPGAALPRLDVALPGLQGSPANVALLIAIAAAIATGVFLFRTRRGFEVRAIGLNPAAAEYGGIGIGSTQTFTLALSGAVAGLGGANFVLGYKHFFEMGFSAGAGFLGIAVALLGRNHPLGICIAALFFGALSHGGFVINQRVPRELVDLLQALVILIAISAQAVIGRAARRHGWWTPSCSSPRPCASACRTRWPRSARASASAAGSSTSGSRA